MWSGSEGRPDGSNHFNLTWVWIIVGVAAFAALFSGRLGGSWWIIFPLLWWVVPAIRRAAESPEDRARRDELRMERQRQKHEYKLERYRVRHPERYERWTQTEKRKHDEAETLDDLADEKQKRSQNPRYVLIGDGEIMPVDGDDPLPDVEPPLRSKRDSDYV